MSQINVDTIRSRTGTAPQLDKGVEVTVGYGITGAGGVNVTGFGTFAGVNGSWSSSDLTVRNLTGVAATFTSTLTYEDVTNVDAVGYATFRSGINVQGAGSTTTTMNVTGVCTAASYQGDGSALTGIAATDNINTNAIQVSGITTFQSLMEPFDFWMFGG